MVLGVPRTVLTNIYLSGKSYFVYHIFLLPIVLPIVLPIGIAYWPLLFRLESPWHICYCFLI